MKRFTTMALALVLGFVLAWPVWAGTAVSDLPAASTVNNTDRVILDQSGSVRTATISQLALQFAGGSVSHEDLEDLLGGAASDHYHITGAQHSELVAWLAANILGADGSLTLPESAYLNFGGTAGEGGYGIRDNAGTMQYKSSGGSWADIGSGGGVSDHESLTGLLGGAASDHYHLTGAQHATLTGWVASGIAHADLTGLLGGGEYHLSSTQYTSLSDWLTGIALEGVGSLRFPASSYLSFGATLGDLGYGIRDNAGAIEYKDSGGAWTALNSLGGGGGASWDSGTVSSPGQYFTSAPSTGVSYPSNGLWEFSLAGLHRFSIEDKVLRLGKGSDTTETWGSAYYGGLRLGSRASIYTRDDDGGAALILASNSWPSTGTTQNAIAYGKISQINLDNGDITFRFANTTAAGGAAAISTQATMRGTYKIFDFEYNVGVGNVGTAMGTTTRGAIGLKVQTPPTAGVTDIAMLYAKDVGGYAELMGMDEQGFETQLTAHNFDRIKAKATHAVPWVWYSQNAYLGKRVDIDLVALALTVQKLTGRSDLIVFTNIPKRDWDTDQEAHVARVNAKVVADREAKVAVLVANGYTPEEAEAVVPPAKLITKKAPPGWLKARLDKQL